MRARTVRALHGDDRLPKAEHEEVSALDVTPPAAAPLRGARAVVERAGAVAHGRLEDPCTRAAINASGAALLRAQIDLSQVNSRVKLKSDGGMAVAIS